MAQPAGPGGKPEDPPNAWMAFWNDDDADPVGRGCGVPLPPAEPPCGGVTPCCSRHVLKVELCDVREPEPEPGPEPEPEPEPDPEPERSPVEPVPVEPPHAATATVTIATSAMAPRTAGRVSRPS